MNKRLIVIGIVLWSMIAVIGVAAFGILAIRGGFKQNFSDFGIYQWQNKSKDFKEVESQVISEDIQSVSINWVKGSVKLLKSDDNTVKIIHKADNNGDNQKKISIIVEDSRLMITDDIEHFMRLMPATSLEVYLPEKQYNELSVEVVSADVDTNFIRFKELEIESVSGSISFQGEFEDAQIESVSGKIKSDNILADTLALEMVSGNISVKGSINKLNVGTVSGSVDVTSNTMISSFDSDSVSGSVTVRIPENDGFSLSIEKAFSNFICDFPTTIGNHGQVYKNGEAKFDVNTMSGKVHIAKIS